MSDAFEYIFPAIRGIQANREYYVSMCPLKLIPKIFLFNEEELVPELRAQRNLNKNRLPELSRYILDNREDYVFSAITASIDSDVTFTSLNLDDRVGLLHIPMSAQFIINDGQHRRAAIEMALRENPDLKDESIAVVFFLDIGLKRCQQMFADLNRYAIRPSTSLGVLYDHRDDKSQLAKAIVFETEVFQGLVEMERSTLAARSRKLFTLSAIYNASKQLFSKNENIDLETKLEQATEFWNEVGKQFPDWKQVKDNKLSACEVRKEYIHTHGVVLESLGRAGQELLKENKINWKKKLKKLKKINWARSNAELWEGRAMIGGKVSKAKYNVVLTTNVIKNELDLPLSSEEQVVEDAYTRGEYVK